MANSVTGDIRRTEISHFGPYYVNSNCLLLHLNEEGGIHEVGGSGCERYTDPPYTDTEDCRRDGFLPWTSGVTSPSPPRTQARTTYRTTVWRDDDSEIEYVLKRHEVPSTGRQQMSGSGNTPELSRQEISSTGNPPEPRQQEVPSTGNPPEPRRQEVPSTGNTPEPRRQKVPSTGNTPEPRRQKVPITGNPPEPRRQRVHSTGNPPEPHRQEIPSTGNTPKHSRHEASSSSNTYELNRQEIASTENTPGLSRQAIVSTGNTPELGRLEVLSTGNAIDSNRPRLDNPQREDSMISETLEDEGDVENMHHQSAINANSQKESPKRTFATEKSRKEHKLSSPKRLIRKIGKKVGLVRSDDIEQVKSVRTTAWTDQENTIEYELETVDIKLKTKTMKTIAKSPKSRKETETACGTQVNKDELDTGDDLIKENIKTSINEAAKFELEEIHTFDHDQQSKDELISSHSRDLLSQSGKLDDGTMEFIDEDRTTPCTAAKSHNANVIEAGSGILQHLETYSNENVILAMQTGGSNKTKTVTPTKKVKSRKSPKSKNLFKFATESKATYLKKMEQTSVIRERRHSTDWSSAGSRHVAALFGTQNRWSDSNVLDHWSRYIAVVAIDFGTTYSGYAYSFIHEPDKIYMMRKLDGGDPGIFNQKTPTTILLTPDGAFHSFGFAARDFYHDLDPRVAPRWMYFERFKMMLYEEYALNKEIKLRSTSGKEVYALEIFAHGLAFFKNHALLELSDQSGYGVTRDDILWVITVPAIWKASAKQFMRQAAYEVSWTAGVRVSIICAGVGQRYSTRVSEYVVRNEALPSF